MNKKFLLFVPFYNCEKQIAKLVNQLDNKVCETFDEVIFVNNRSIDNTQKILNDNNNLIDKLINNETNKGKGYSVSKGLHEAEGKYIIFHIYISQ